MFETLRSVLKFRGYDTDADRRRLASAANVDDLRVIAKKRLPGGVFDYIDGGAEDELTLAGNQKAFRDIGLRPRVLCGLTGVDTAGTILGRSAPMPLVLAPTGFTRIADPQGELAVARAAARAGVPYSLSTLSTRSIEEVAAASDGVTWGADGERRLWFQVYTWRDKGLVKEMVERAAASRYEALILTVDLAVLGRRERDVRRGFSLPPKIGLDTIFDGMRHPGWTWRFARSEPIRFANLPTDGENDGSTAVDLAEFTNSQFRIDLSWGDLEWFRSIWDGPIVVKGIQTVDDAVLARDVGFDAVCLSNHGGRQLDGAPATLDLVEPCRQKLGDDVEIIVDGGSRRGSDLLKARALGANSVMAGRSYLYGLGAAGEKGVDFVLDLYQAGLHRTMALCGVSSLDEVSRTLLRCESPQPRG